MPSYRFNQKSKQVAGSTPNRIKYLCPHPDCKKMMPLACASTYARHYRSAHLHERPWACDVPFCTFETTRKTLLQQHKRHVHDEEVTLPKRARGTLTPVAPPTEVEVDAEDNIICYRPTRHNYTWSSHRRTRPVDEPAFMASTSQLSVMRAPVGQRRPSLTVRTSFNSPSYTPMAIPTLPNFSTPPPPARAGPSGMSVTFDGNVPFPDFSNGTVPGSFTNNTSFGLFMPTESDMQQSAYASATAVDSAAPVPWNAWSGPSTPPPKPLFQQQWDTPMTQSSTPSSSPTPFSDMDPTLHQNEQSMFDPELRDILQEIGQLKEFGTPY